MFLDFIKTLLFRSIFGEPGVILLLFLYSRQFLLFTFALKVCSKTYFLSYIIISDKCNLRISRIFTKLYTLCTDSDYCTVNVVVYVQCEFTMYNYTWLMFKSDLISKKTCVKRLEFCSSMQKYSIDNFLGMQN